MSELRNNDQDSVSSEDFTVRARAAGERPLTELDADERIGFVPLVGQKIAENISTLPERIKASQRSPAALAREKTRLEQKGQTAGMGIPSTLAQTKVEARPEPEALKKELIDIGFDLNSEKQKARDEARSDVELNPLVRVATGIGRSAQGLVVGTAPPTKAEELLQEEDPSASSDLSILGTLELFAMAGAYAGDFAKDALTGLLGLSPAYNLLQQSKYFRGEEDIQDPRAIRKAIGRDIGSIFNKLWTDYAGDVSGETFNLLSENSQAINAFYKRVGQDIEKTFELNLPSSADAKNFYKNFKSSVQIPYEDRHPVYTAAGAAGAFLPFGGILGAGRALSLGAANINKGILVGHAIKDVGIQQVYKELPLRQVFNLNLARQTTPDPLIKLIANTSSFKKDVNERFQKFLMPREKALQATLAAKRDLIAAVGGGTAYGIADTYSPDMGEAGKIGISVVGALLANKSLNLVKEATVSGLYGMLGKLAKEDSNTRTKIFQYLKESPSKRNVLFRSAALKGMGYTGTEITQLRRESIETGNSRLADIRNASDEDKIGLKQDAIEKGILTQDGKVNEYYHMELLSSSAFDRETVGFAASFWKKIDNIKDKELRNDFKNSIADIFTYMDNLSQNYPKSMKSFVVLLENATQISVLNTIRQSLLAQAEFTSKKGGFVAGDLITDIDKYSKSLTTNISSLKSVVDEMKGTTKDAPELVSRLVDDLSKSLIKPTYEQTNKRIAAVKAHAASQQNKEREELFKLGERVQLMSGLKGVDDPKFMLESSKVQQNLFEGTFDNATKSVNKQFETLKQNHKNVQIDITDALGVTPTAGEIDVPIRGYLKRFGEISPSMSKKLQEDLSTNFFNANFGPAVIDKATGAVDIDKALRIISDDILENRELFKGTVEQKTEILEQITKSVDAAEGNNAKLLAIKLGLSDVIDMPAKINVSSFLDLRSELSKRATRYYRSNEFKSFNDVTERIEALDDVLEMAVSTKLFKEDYRNARKFYKDNLGRFNDRNSPFNKFVFRAGEEGQVINPAKLFDKFLTGNMVKNASDFQKAFQNPTTGEYNQQAIQQLLFAFSRKAIPDYNNASFKSLNTIITENLPFFDDILIASKNGEFADTLRKMHSYRMAPGLASSEQKTRINKLLEDNIAVIHKNFENNFNISAAQQFTETELSALGKVMDKTQSKPGDPDKKIDILFGLTGRSLEFPVVENYMATLKNTQEYLNLNPETKRKFDNIINSKEFIDKLNAISPGGQGSSPNQLGMETILKDVEARSPQILEQTQNDFRAILFDKMSEAMFPAIKSYTKTPRERTASEQFVINKVSTDMGISQTDVALGIGIRDPEIVNRVRNIAETQKSAIPNFNAGVLNKLKVGRFGTTYKFNLDNELDPVAMKLFYDKNKKAFDLLLDEKHKEALDSLMNLSVITGSKRFSQALKNMPSTYSTQMALGRTYNAMKGVVSWRYLVMEKVISDYRLAQADIMKSLLADKNTAIVMRDILARGVFKPKEFRQMAKYWMTRLVPFGYKLRPGGMDKMEEDFERIAGFVSQELEEKEEN